MSDIPSFDSGFDNGFEIGSDDALSSYEAIMGLPQRPRITAAPGRRNTFSSGTSPMHRDYNETQGPGSKRPNKTTGPGY